MIEFGQCLGFMVESFSEVGLFRVMGEQGLDRHASIQCSMVGEIDNTERATSNLVVYLIFLVILIFNIVFSLINLLDGHIVKDFLWERNWIWNKKLVIVVW